MAIETLPKRARTNRIAVDLKALHGPWTDWCKAHNLTPSEAVRRVLTVVLDGNPVSPAALTSAAVENPSDDDRRRIEVRLPNAEYLAVAAAASREGMSMPRWLMGLVKVHLTGEALLGAEEVEVLARSNKLLLALGRNINQIAYNMSQRADRDELTVAQVNFVASFLKEHTQAVSGVLQANNKRWRQ